ncbi:tetratricopeptide repeat protein, partial [bacterium]|nr:tetratricopeptide repeat protein [bacterium]
SYVLKEEYWHYMTIEMERGVFQDPNGITYALFRTLMGDGVFADDEGGEYVVDSGCIAVLPACVCNEEDMESAYGEVFEMMAPFTAEWEPQDGEEGDICVNNIFIHTNPLRESNNQGDIAANDEILVLADQRFDDDQFEEAINLYTQAIELFPSNEDLFVNRGLAKEMLGDDEGAINDYQNAIKINPVNSNALFLLGSRKAQTNDLEEAIIILSKSIEIDPTSDNSSAYRYRGIARNDIGNYAEALSDFFKLIEFDSCDGESYLLIGYNYIKLENYQDSLYYLNKAIKVFEVNTGDEYDVSECYLYLGNANSELGDLEGACRNWKIATDLDNDDARAMYEKNCPRQ